MRIAIDIDGVLYEWADTARYLLSRYTDSKVPHPRSWYGLRDAVDTDAWNWLWSEHGGIAAGLFRHGDVVNGAVDGVMALVRQGHELVIATHRPRAAIRDTLAWIDYTWSRCDPYPWSGVHLLCEQEPKSTVPADILVDDKGANIREWADAGRIGILFRRPWSGLRAGPRTRPWRVASSWGAVVSIVEDVAMTQEVKEG